MSKVLKFVKSSKREKKEKLKFLLNRIKFLLKRENNYIPNGYKANQLNKEYNPKVSVLLPIYNHANVAKYAINSVLSQTYKNIELIILDDGSKDDLLKILKPYNNLENVHIYTQKNQKLPRALTHLHRLANGDFITWTSADNIMHPEMIQKLVEKLIENPDAALVYGDVYVINKNNRPYYGICRDIDRDFKYPNIIRLSRSDKPLSIGTDNYINASFLYRKENSDILMGKYGDDIIGAEDYDFWLKMQKTGKLKHICNKNPYYYYRIHNNSMSHEIETKKTKQHQSRLENLRKYEQQRIMWCKIRPNIILDNSLPKEIKINLNEKFNELPVDINAKNSKKNIIFSNVKKNEDIYYLVTDDYYILINNIVKKEIVKLFTGLDIPREAYKARNLYSHSYYQDDLIRIKKPIFGCHINSKTINVDKIVTIINNNKDKVFVIYDEIKNESLEKVSNENENLIYYSNKVFGMEYQAYSYFSRVINFDNESVMNKYKNLLLAYAIGRMISYDCNDDFFKIYPFTYGFNEKIEFYESDPMSEENYNLMDKYILKYSKKGILNRCLKYYNGHTQEMYIDRPKYIVDNIPEESDPIKVNYDEK